MQGDPSVFPMSPMGLPPATVRRLHWDGRPRCKHRGVVCKAIRACSRCVYRRLLCGGCTGTGALDVFTPIHRPFEFFSKSQRTSPMENFFNVKTPQKFKVVKPPTKHAPVERARPLTLFLENDILDAPETLLGDDASCCSRATWMHWISPGAWKQRRRAGGNIGAEKEPCPPPGRRKVKFSPMISPW